MGASGKLFHWAHITVARTSLVRGKVLKRKEEKRKEGKRNARDKRGGREGRSGMTLLVGTGPCLAARATEWLGAPRFTLYRGDPGASMGLEGHPNLDGTRPCLSTMGFHGTNAC